MFTRAIAVGFALVAIGCGTDVTGEKHIDLPSTLTVSPAFSNAQIETIFAAADQWKRATGGAADLKPEIGSHGGVWIRPSTSLDKDDLGSSRPEFGADDIRIALATNASEARASKVTPEAELEDTVLHELGHAFLGPDHTETGLMTAAGYGGGCIDELSVRRFCEHYACPASAASTCPSL